MTAWSGASSAENGSDFMYYQVDSVKSSSLMEDRILLPVELQHVLPVGCDAVKYTKSDAVMTSWKFNGVVQIWQNI